MKDSVEKFSKETLFLVTGGAGFIGSNLCERLLKGGYRVRCLDNFSTGLKQNVEIFIDNPNYEFIEGDISDYDTCFRACKNVTYVLHQASLGSVARSLKMPCFYVKNNVLGSVNVMEAARNNHVKKFVYASSSTVYGDSEILPRLEGQEGRSISPYASTKLMVEEYARQYSLNFGLDTYGLRYFNVFGARQNPNSNYAAVIPSFVSCLLKNEAPTIHGDGLQSRDFTYIENIIEANLLACLAPSEIAGEVFNVGCGDNFSLLKIYDIISELLNKKIQPKFDVARKGDVRHSLADISKARNLLGYTPKYDFMQGIALTVDWYKNFFEEG